MDKGFLPEDENFAAFWSQSVAILIIMDKGFLREERGLHLFKKEVAILIIMDKGFLQNNNKNKPKPKPQVAILIIMDKGFLHKTSIFFETFITSVVMSKRRNPYYNG